MDLLRITRNPNNLLFALFISIIAHFALLYVLGFLPFSHKSLQEESILVDFTLMDGKEGAGGRGQGSEDRRQKSEDRGKRGSGEGKEGKKEQGSGSRGEDIRQSSDPAMNKSIETNSVIGVTQGKVQAPSIDLVSLNPVAGQRGRGGEADGSLQKGGGAGSGGAGHGGGGGTDKGSGSSGGGGGNRLHDYGYVREIVMKHLKYPEKARRMGLEGSIKVVESSGFQMLDDAASDAISRVNLSRSNPHRLIVHLPVEFRLR
ncbi:MAG: energy transducer TonB [Proteobacteria bacterium]|nr:energy transducer TonB [Pseudomonadota bacterium]